MSSTPFQPAEPFTLRVRVYYEDTDAGGIVYHANWLRFLERARSEWLRALGWSHARLEHEHGLMLVVASMAIDWKRPARLDDLLDIDVRVAAVGRASVTFRQTARRVGDGTACVAADVRVAAVSIAGGRPAPFPRDLFACLPPPTEVPA